MTSDKEKRIQVALALINAWIEKQGFDPNGGPTDDADWHVVNAALILDGSIPVDHDAARGALKAAGIRELVVIEGGRS